MMLAPSGEKLSKRHGAVSVTEYRDNGYSPDAVFDYLARFGWSPGEREVRLSKRALVEAFDWAQCGRGDGKFDPKKFLAVNHEHLKTRELTPDDEYAVRTAPFLRARGLQQVEAAEVERPLHDPRSRSDVRSSSRDARSVLSESTRDG